MRTRLYGVYIRPGNDSGDASVKLKPRKDIKDREDIKDIKDIKSLSPDVTPSLMSSSRDRPRADKECRSSDRVMDVHRKQVQGSHSLVVLSKHLQASISKNDSIFRVHGVENAVVNRLNLF